MTEPAKEKPTINDQLVLICGLSSTGKSASLRNIRNQQNWAYCNTEAGKRLPFKNKFKSFRIVDPRQVYEVFDHYYGNPENEGIIIDSMTFLMDMYETQLVLTSANTMKAWSDYQQFFKTLMQEKIASFSQPVIVTAHVKDVFDEKAMEYKTAVPVKGALSSTGIEAYFSTIVMCKRKSIADLEKYENDMLHITDEDRSLGFKHVFQTRLTPTTLGERIRSPLGLFSDKQTFIDNDCQILLDHLKDYYA